MRGEVERQRAMLSVVSAEHRIPADHPLRRIKALADVELARLSPVFDRMYAERGRPSVPPERLLKACLLIALYSIRSERQLCEQLQYNLLFQWFLELDLHAAAFDASTFAKNKERLLRADVARRFFEGVVQQAKAARLLSAEHFTVDGTLIEAWASLKSFRPKGERPEDRPPPDDPGNPTVDFHGARRSNATHASITASDALLARKGKGKEAKLAFAGHVLNLRRVARRRALTPIQCARTVRGREPKRAQINCGIHGFGPCVGQQTLTPCCLQSLTVSPPLVTPPLTARLRPRA